MISSRQQQRLLVSGLIAAMSLGAMACKGTNAASSEQISSALPQSSAGPLEVSTAAAIARELPNYFEATGSMLGDEQTDVAPAVGGKVVSVAVDLGSFVQKGAVLVRLDDRDARLRLDQAQAQQAQQLAVVAQAEARLGLSPNEKFEPTNVPDVRSLKAALDLADKQLKRNQQLLESGDIPRASYDQVKATRDSAYQNYEVALNSARQNYAAVLTARAGLAGLKAQIEQANKAISDAQILAPFSGYVADRQADPGEYVTTTSKIVTLVRTNPLRLRLDVPEQAIALVRVGQTVAVNVSAYGERAFAGHIARISPNITSASRTLTVEAEIENSEGLLKPGQFATARILQPKPDAAVLVPARAVITDATNTSRIFIVKDGKAEQRLVQLGQKDGDLVEIRGGIAAGEIVATTNVEKLSDGAKVKH